MGEPSEGTGPRRDRSSECPEYTKPLPEMAIEYWAIDINSEGLISRSHHLKKAEGAAPRLRTMEPFKSDEIRVVFIRMKPSADLAEQQRKRRWGLSPHLFNFWDKHMSGESISFSAPLIFHPFGEEGHEWETNTVLLPQLKPGMPKFSTSAVIWKGMLAIIFQAPGSLRFNWNDNGSFEAEIRFFEPASQHNPLEEPFQSLISSPLSATALYNGRQDFGAQLLALDFFHAQINCWIGFLNAFLKEISRPEPRDTLTDRLLGDIPPEQSPEWGYANNLSWLHRVGKEKRCCIEMTSRVVRLSASGLDEAHKIRVEQVLLNLEGQCLIQSLLLERIQNRFELTTGLAEKRARKRQEAAVKLLTWIACIFLPLSTASSLLSMSSRAKDIGSVWWDWLSIVFITGLVVLLGYSWTMKSFLLRHSILFFVVRNIFTDSKRTTLKNNDTKHLVHPGVRFLLLLGICAFALGATTAFLIGMFDKLETGAVVLGSSVAGAVGLVVTPLLIWRSVNFGLWLRRSIRSRSWIWPVHFPVKIKLSPKKKNTIVLVSAILGILLVCGLILVPVFLMSLLTGSMVFELVYRIVQNMRRTVEKAGVKTDIWKSKKGRKRQGKMKTAGGTNDEDRVVDAEQGLAVSGPRSGESELPTQEQDQHTPNVDGVTFV